MGCCSNWEAAFFQVYFQACQCKIAEIGSAAVSLGNCIRSTCRLIAEHEAPANIDKALNTVVDYTFDIATTMYFTAIEEYTKHVSINTASVMNERCAAVIQMTKTLEDTVQTVFPGKSAILNKIKKLRLEKDLCAKDEVSTIKADLSSSDPSYTPPQSGCYVATAVYGSYDCPEVWTLRRFRDETLAETWYGRAFIHFYYAISPSLVKWLGETQWFRNLWKPKLDRMVQRLNEDGIPNTPYHDRQW